jgi:hypothetical protein
MFYRNLVSPDQKTTTAHTTTSKIIIIIALSSSRRNSAGGDRKQNYCEAKGTQAKYETHIQSTVCITLNKRTRPTTTVHRPCGPILSHFIALIEINTAQVFEFAKDSLPQNQKTRLTRSHLA